MTLNSMIDVSAALIFRDGKLLITQRHADAHLGGLWEFPGGKRAGDETFEACLVREIREELGVEIAVGDLFDEITHAYGEKVVHLKFFICRLRSGEPRPIDCADLRWVEQGALDRFKFPAADEQLLGKLRRWDFGS